MSQYDFGTINPADKSGSQLATDLNSWRDAVHSSHKGSTAPTYAVAGMFWLDDTTATNHLLKYYDGTDWTAVLAIDTTTNRASVVTAPERLSFPLAGGTANALTLTPAVALAAYFDMDVVTFEAAANNTDAVTLTVSGLGTKAIQKIVDGADVALVRGDILDGNRYALNYDANANAGTGAFILINPSVIQSPKFGGEVGLFTGSRDIIINGEGRVNQRSYTTVADDTYWCDRHYVLTQTATITPTILSNVANGLPSMMRLTQSQATAQRMGNAQIIEGGESRRHRGKKVTLGGVLRCSSSQPIRFAVLEWTGTEDSVTSDVVNSWTNGTFTAGQFFLGSNLTVAAVGTITPAANTLTDWSLVATISGSCNNLIVFCWAEGTAAQNVTLDMVWGLVGGDASAEKYPYSLRHIQQELDLCQRYYELVTGFGTWGSTAAGQTIMAPVSMNVPKRAVPTFGTITWTAASNASGQAIAYPSVDGFMISITAVGTGTVHIVGCTVTANAEL